VSTNSVESVLVLLACGAVGAIFSSTAPDMGAKGIADRYVQIHPKILFVDSAVVYAGRRHELRKKLSNVIAELRQCVEHFGNVVVLTGPTWKDQGL